MAKRHLLIVDDGSTVRIDGYERGAILINKQKAGYRLRLTREDGGEFIVDQCFRKSSEIGQRLAKAFWIVRQPRTAACHVLGAA